MFSFLTSVSHSSIPTYGMPVCFCVLIEVSLFKAIALCSSGCPQKTRINLSPVISHLALVTLEVLQLHHNSFATLKRNKNKFKINQIWDIRMHDLASGTRTLIVFSQGIYILLTVLIFFFKHFMLLKI